jgi:phosphate transport system substrate-binding protein
VAPRFLKRDPFLLVRQKSNIKVWFWHVCIVLGMSGLTACDGRSLFSEPLKRPFNDTTQLEKTDAEHIRVVGSSTVYPFATKVAQEFKNKTGHTVVVEATGSGGGHKLFCSGFGPNSPDVTNSSRRQKKTEFEKCVANGVTEIIEIKIGYDGIVIANAIDGPIERLDLKDIFLSFAKDIPNSDTDCRLRPNPYTQWSELNPDLPNSKIEAYGPPPTSGTRDAFVETAMELGAKAIPCLAELSYRDEVAFKKIAHNLREDGYWIDAGENDNALVQTLVNTPDALGIFGFSFLDQNIDKVKGITVGSAKPEFARIASGEYPVSRSLFVYFKKSKIETHNSLKEFALEFTSDEASGEAGYLEDIGLVPLSAEERAKIRQDVEQLRPYTP